MERNALLCELDAAESEAPENDPEIIAALIKFSVPPRCTSCRPMPSPLWQAVRERNVDLVGAIIKKCSVDIVNGQKCPGLYYCNINCYKYLNDSAINRAHATYTFFKSMPLLHFAVTRGEVRIINQLIIAGAELDARDIHDNTVLEYALETKNYSAIEALVSSGVDVNAYLYDLPKYSTFRFFLNVRKIKLMKFLLDLSANPCTKMHNGWTMLHYAAVSNIRNMKLVSRLSNGVDIDDVTDDGYTALQLAVRYKNMKMVKWLLKRKADPCKRISNDSPLMMVVERGMLPVVKTLLRYKACPNQRESNKPTILQVACNRGHESIALELIEAGANLTDVDQSKTHVIHSVVKSGMFSVIKEVVSRISRKAVNARDQRGYTPLLWACKKADKETVKLLLDNGACLKETTKAKENVLHCLAITKYSELTAVEIAEYLIDRGVNTMNKFNRKGLTPFHLACIKNKLALVDLFSKRGADIHLRTNYGRSPLLLSVKNGSYASVLYFLSLGSKINEVCETRGTALHLACEYELRHTIQVLLDHGADINIVNSSDQTPFSLIDQQEGYMIMIRHIAKMTIRGQYVNEADMDTISTNEVLREFYDNCVTELVMMRTSHFYNSIKWLDVLFMPHAELEGLYNNRMFVEMTIAHLEAKPYPMYHREVRVKFERLKMKRRIVEEAEQVVFDVFSGYLPVEIMQHIAKLTIQKELNRIENRRVFDFSSKSLRA